MTHIEPNLTRFLQRMEAMSAFLSLRSFDAPTLAQCLEPRAKTASVFDFDAAQAALNGPGWYDSSWDLIQGLVVHESTAAGAGKLDDWGQCLFA